MIMNKYYDIGTGTLSRPVIEKALNRLAQLLKVKNKRIELVAAGGVISVMVFGSRHMTRDIDVIIPPKDKALVADYRVCSRQEIAIAPTIECRAKGDLQTQL